MLLELCWIPKLIEAYLVESDPQIIHSDICSSSMVHLLHVVFINLDSFSIKLADYITILPFYIFLNLSFSCINNRRFSKCKDVNVEQLWLHYTSNGAYIFRVEITTNPPTSRIKVDHDSISVGGAATIRHAGQPF